MRKYIILFLYVVASTCFYNVQAVGYFDEDPYETYDLQEDNLENNNIIMIEQKNPYEEKIIECDDGWTIIKSPLKKSYFINTDLEIYRMGDEKSEEIIIDVERSLAFSNYFLVRLYNTVMDIGSSYLDEDYKLSYKQFIVMLGIAAEIPYDWESKYANPFDSAWSLNYSWLLHKNNLEMCVSKFKQKFPYCKRIKLLLCTSNQKIVITHTHTLKYFYEALEKNDIKLVDKNDADLSEGFKKNEFIKVEGDDSKNKSDPKNNQIKLADEYNFNNIVLN